MELQSVLLEQQVFLNIRKKKEVNRPLHGHEIHVPAVRTLTEWQHQLLSHADNSDGLRYNDMQANTEVGLPLACWAVNIDLVVTTKDSGSLRHLLCDS